jgi:hypothetical protein
LSAWYQDSAVGGELSVLCPLLSGCRFWWDILTVLPWDWIVLSAMGLMGSASAQARFLSLLGLLKLVRGGVQTGEGGV